MQILQQLKNRLGKNDRLLAKGMNVAFAGVSVNMAMGLLLLMMGLCYYLIPRMGISGAAIAYAVSNSVICVLCLGEVLWLYRIESMKTAED